jgi:hypothetical protein
MGTGRSVSYRTVHEFFFFGRIIAAVANKAEGGCMEILFLL